MSDKPTLVPKGRYKLEYRGTECLNCGHPLQMSDKFCPNCSQANSTKKLTLKDFFDEFFSSLISYDSKLLRTLSALLIRPGKITREYISGKRASYTNPFRFLLSLAIVYFLMINFSGNFSKYDRYGIARESEIPEKLENFDSLDLFITTEEDGVMLKKEFDSIKDSQKLRDILKKIKERDSAMLVRPTQHFNAARDSTFSSRLGHKYDFFKAAIKNDSASTYDEAVDKFDLQRSFENRLAFNSANGLLRFQREPGTFFSIMVSKLPFAVFFFLPVFTLFIWLAYVRKKYTYTDHLIFGFHITSLLFILLIISYLIDSIFDVKSGWVFVTIFATYLFVAMRKFYRQNVFKTTVKYIFLNAIFFILALFAVLALFLGNIFTY